MFVDRRPFPTASGSLNFDFGKEYGRTPQVWAEGGVFKTPALEGINEETLPPNQEHKNGGDFRFNGVYYQPWARDVKPLFQGSRMPPPLNYNRLPIGAEHLKRGVDRGGTMIDEEGKLVKVANYASNFKLKGNSAQELRRSFLLQSLQNLNNKPSVRARDNILRELKSRGLYSPGDENLSISELEQKIEQNKGRNGMSENPWSDDPVFMEIKKEIESAKQQEEPINSILQERDALIAEIQQLNENSSYERAANQQEAQQAQQPVTGFGAQQQGGDLAVEEGVMEDLRQQQIREQERYMFDFEPVPRTSGVLNREMERQQNLGYGDEIHTNQPPPPGNDYTARGQQEPFFTPPQSERQRQQLVSGQGGNTVEPGQEQREVSQQQAQQQIQEELPTDDPRAFQELPQDARQHVESIIENNTNLSERDFREKIKKDNSGIAFGPRQRGIAWKTYKRKTGKK
jgi:hypothetical protein